MKPIRRLSQIVIAIFLLVTGLAHASPNDWERDWAREQRRMKAERMRSDYADLLRLQREALEAEAIERQNRQLQEQQMQFEPGTYDPVARFRTCVLQLNDERLCLQLMRMQ